MKEATKSDAERAWLKRRKGALGNADRKRSHLLNNTKGRGGGFFLALHNLEPDSQVIVKLVNVTIEQNTAEIGGAAFLCESLLQNELRWWIS